MSTTHQFGLFSKAFQMDHHVIVFGYRRKLQTTHPRSKIYRGYLGNLCRYYRKFFYDAHNHLYFELLAAAIYLTEKLRDVIENNVNDGQLRPYCRHPALPGAKYSMNSQKNCTH